MMIGVDDYVPRRGVRRHNVWVANIIEDHPFHERARNKLNQLVSDGEILHLSRQIVREVVSVCTLGRNLSHALSWPELRPHLDAVISQTVLLEDHGGSIRKLIDLAAQHAVLGKQIHDTNIVATMLTHGITRLVTFNPDDFKRFAEIEIIVP